MLDTTENYVHRRFRFLDWELGFTSFFVLHGGACVAMESCLKSLMH